MPPTATAAEPAAANANEAAAGGISDGIRHRMLLSFRIPIATPRDTQRFTRTGRRNRRTLAATGVHLRRAPPHLWREKSHRNGRLGLRAWPVRPDTDSPRMNSARSRRASAAACSWRSSTPRSSASFVLLRRQLGDVAAVQVAALGHAGEVAAEAVLVVDDPADRLPGLLRCLLQPVQIGHPLGHRAKRVAHLGRQVPGAGPGGEAVAVEVGDRHRVDQRALEGHLAGHGLAGRNLDGDAPGIGRPLDAVGVERRLPVAAGARMVEKDPSSRG